MAGRISAGVLLFRRVGDGLEVLLAHPGGPFFRARDAGVWTIPKGEVEATDPADALERVARREFLEETSHSVPDGPLLDLGEVRQEGGKVVHAWAAQGDLDPATARPNTFEIEWPPRSGRKATFPEIDRVAWFDPDTARRIILPAQAVLIDRLEVVLGARPG